MFHKTSEVVDLEKRLQSILAKRYPDVLVNIFGFEKDLLIKMDVVSEMLDEPRISNLDIILPLIQAEEPKLYETYVLVILPVTRAMFAQRIDYDPEEG